jgi:Site-specific DNA methylase
MEKVQSFDTSLSVTDLFCGCGGSSLGAEAAGMEVKLALNHWDRAVETHSQNHPSTVHDCVDVAGSRPDRYPSTQILWASPECVSHSLASGTKYKEKGQEAVFDEDDPSDVRSRCTMWDIPRWTEWHEYEYVVVENVPDARKWRLFEPWLEAMNTLGYRWKVVWLNSMFAYPTPQSRNRMYVVFWQDGNEAPDLDIRPPAYCKKCAGEVRGAFQWRDTKRGRQNIGLRYGQQYEYTCPRCGTRVEPYRYAAFNVIDFSVEAPTIGERDRPLADNTIQRVKKGLEEYGRDPLVIKKALKGDGGGGLVCPTFLQKQNSGSQRPRRLDEPMGTQTTSLSDAVVTVPPQLASVNYFDSRALDSTAHAYPTQTTQTKWAVAEPPVYLAKLHGTSGAEPITEPLGCVLAGGNHHALVEGAGFLSYYYSSSSQNSGLHEPTGTVTTRDRMALVEAKRKAKDVDVEECTFRMLRPHEVKAAMGFPQWFDMTGDQKREGQDAWE